MARRTISIDEKIGRQEKVVAELKAKYDAAVDELEKLVTKKKQLNEKKLLDAYHRSTKTAEEIIAFINSDESQNED